MISENEVQEKKLQKIKSCKKESLKHQGTQNLAHAKSIFNGSSNMGQAYWAYYHYELLPNQLFTVQY